MPTTILKWKLWRYICKEQLQKIIWEHWPVSKGSETSLACSNSHIQQHHVRISAISVKEQGKLHGSWLLSRNSNWFKALLVAEVDSHLPGPPSSNLLLPSIRLNKILPCKLKAAHVKSWLMQSKLTALSSSLLVRLYTLVSKTLVLVSE